MSSLTRETSRAVALLVASVLAAVGLVAIGPSAPAHATANQMYDLVNQARVSAGLPRLARNASMDAVAQSWSQKMAASGTLSHNPSYSSQIPSGWTRAGENVGYGGSVTTIHNALMNSSGHRANILGDFTSIGIGWHYDGRVYWATQVFAKYAGVTAPSGSTSYSPQRLSDLTGDRNADVVARDGDGRLYLYPGNGKSGFLSRALLGPGWGGMRDVLAPGDVTGDGRSDLWARDGGGRLWLYPGNGRGGFASARQVGSGWSGMSALATPADFNRDGRNDLLARDSGGRLWLYAGNGKGGFSSWRQVGSGWSAMTAIVGAGDVTGDKVPDVVARSSAGVLYVYPGNGKGGFLSGRQLGSGWNGMNKIVNVGDWNGDRIPDVLARDTGGRLWMYPGSGKGTFGSARQIGSGWQGMTALS